MSQHYKRFLALLEKWPIDKTKTSGRDLGHHLREQLQTVLGSTNIVAVKEDHFIKQFQSLENLVNDVHAKKYPRTLKSTSTGLTGEQCRQVLSEEFLEYLNKK